MKEEIARVVQTLRRQRVRQGDCLAALDCVIAQAAELNRYDTTGAVEDAATQMREGALELKRVASSVPKFVVEDLIEECIRRLESLSPLDGGSENAD